MSVNIFSSTQQEICGLNERISKVETAVIGLEDKVGALDQKFDALDKKIDEKFNNFSSSFAVVVSHWASNTTSNSRISSENVNLLGQLQQSIPVQSIQQFSEQVEEKEEKEEREGDQQVILPTLLTSKDTEAHAQATSHKRGIEEMSQDIDVEEEISEDDQPKNPNKKRFSISDKKKRSQVIQNHS